MAARAGEGGDRPIALRLSSVDTLAQVPEAPAELSSAQPQSSSWSQRVAAVHAGALSRAGTQEAQSPIARSGTRGSRGEIEVGRRRATFADEDEEYVGRLLSDSTTAGVNSIDLGRRLRILSETSSEESPRMGRLFGTKNLNKTRSGIEALMSAHGFVEGSSSDVATTSTDTSAFVRQFLNSQSRDLQGMKAVCHWLAETPAFRIFFAALVLLSSVLMTIEADLRVDRASSPQDSNKAEGFLNWMDLSEHVLVALFVIEIVIRVAGCPRPPWRDGWIVFDSVILSIAVLDGWILRPLSTLDVFSKDSDSCFAKVWCVVRALRALRVLRLLRYFRPMRVIVKALGRAFLGIVLLVAFAVLFTFCLAVVFTSVIGQMPGLVEGQRYTWDWSTSTLVPRESTDPAAEYFDCVVSSMLTLNLVIVQGIQWGPMILWPLLSKHDLQHVTARILLIVVLLYLLTCLLKLIHAIFVTNFIDAAKLDESKRLCELLTKGDVSLRKLRDCFFEFLRNGDLLSLQDLQDGLVAHPEICRKTGLMPHHAKMLFRLMDTNGSNSVSLDEFLTGFLKVMRSSRPVDMIGFDHQLNKIFKELYGIGEDSDRDFQLLGEQYSHANEQYCNITSTMAQLVACVDNPESYGARRSTICPNAPLLPQPAGGLLDQVFGDLETRFTFKTRLERMQASVRMRSIQAQGPEAEGGAATSAKLEAVWREVLFVELLPWLQSFNMAAAADSSPAKASAGAAATSAAGAAAPPATSSRRGDVPGELPLSCMGAKAAKRAASGESRSGAKVPQARDLSEDNCRRVRILGRALRSTTVELAEAAEELQPSLSRARTSGSALKSTAFVPCTAGRDSAGGPQLGDSAAPRLLRSSQRAQTAGSALKATAFVPLEGDEAQPDLLRSRTAGSAVKASACPPLAEGMDQPRLLRSRHRSSTAGSVLKASAFVPLEKGRSALTSEDSQPDLLRARSAPTSEDSQPDLLRARTDGSSLKGSPFFPRAIGRASGSDVAADDDAYRELQRSRSVGSSLRPSASLRSPAFGQRRAAKAEGGGGSSSLRQSPMLQAALRSAGIFRTDDGWRSP